MVYLFNLNYNFVLIGFLLVSGALKGEWSDHAVFVSYLTLNVTSFFKLGKYLFIICICLLIIYPLFIFNFYNLHFKHA
mgnify:CR=1 FL=1